MYIHTHTHTQCNMFSFPLKQTLVTPPPTHFEAAITIFQTKLHQHVRTSVCSAPTLLIRGRISKDRMRAVIQHELRRVLRGLVCDGHAVACQQLPGHEAEGGVHVLGLLGWCFQSSQHTVVFCQSARVLEQHLPLSVEVRLVTCSDEQDRKCLQQEWRKCLCSCDFYQILEKVWIMPQIHKIFNI